MMGGSIHPDGLIPRWSTTSIPKVLIPVVEHNFECDPVATKIVMDSAIPKVLIPVDLTLEFPMTDEFQALFHES
jgi:inosine-uridine nucleoside N-ribohydrolase